MIPTMLPGWTARADDGAVLLVPDGEPLRGRIRYLERRRPLRGIAAIAMRDDSEPGFTADQLVGHESMVTHEGEYAAIARVDGRVDGCPAWRTIGAVFADDFYSFIDGLVLDRDDLPAMQETVRQLTAADAHMLGVRRRRFLYAAPRGWRARHDLFTSRYTPPERPDTSLLVFPALPLPGGAVHLDELAFGSGGLLDGFRIEREDGPIELDAPSGLSGFGWLVEGGRRDEETHARLLVLLHDHRYAYGASLDTPVAEVRWGKRVLLDLVQTMRPIPRPAARERGAGATTLAFWAE